MQEAVTADSVAVDVSQVSYEPVSEVPAFGVTSSTQMGESVSVCCVLQVNLHIVRLVTSAPNQFSSCLHGGQP